MSVLKAFNGHFLELWDDILRVLPDKNIKAGRILLVNMNRMNPSLLIKCWYEYVAVPYNSQIEKGDFAFFLQKDYVEDLGESPQYDSPKMLKIIKQLKVKAQAIGKNNHMKISQYIRNLTKLCYLYFNVTD